MLIRETRRQNSLSGTQTSSFLPITPHLNLNIGPEAIQPLNYRLIDQSLSRMKLCRLPPHELSSAPHWDYSSLLYCAQYTHHRDPRIRPARTRLDVDLEQHGHRNRSLTIDPYWLLGVAPSHDMLDNGTDQALITVLSIVFVIPV